MKKLTIVYTIISYIVIVFAGLLGIVDLLALLISLANPVQLVSALILAGVVVYSFISFIFCIKAVQKGKACKPSLNIWMKVTGIITVIFAVQALVSSVGVVTHPSSMNDYYEDIVKMQRQMMKAQPSAAGTVITRDSFFNTASIVFYILEFYCLLLLVHVTITFRLLKQYSYLFGKGNKDQQSL